MWKLQQLGSLGYKKQGEKEILSAILMENIFHNRVHLIANIAFIEEY